MDYYETVPAELRGELNIPSKWTPGTPCPNCINEGREGILLLLDTGADREHYQSPTDWVEGETNERFELVCSAWRDNYCSFFPYPLGSISATVPDDYTDPY